ncbi:MAG: valine--tRNA ligase [Dehalococcoidia bacterium]
MADNADWVKSIEFGDLPKNLDLAAVEAKWRERWDDLGIHSRDLLKQRADNFVIDSPPPTVSGSLHVGHVFSYTHQDVIARYRRMRGANVVYPMGWDDNGLPTERRVQNFFNVRTEPDVPYKPNLDVEAERAAAGLKKDRPLVISRQNFIELCHIVTAQDEVVFKNLFQRLGFSIDWREEYATIDDRCRRIAQRSFLDLYEKDHIYQVESPTMWDVDFQTAVAQAEVEDRPKQGAYHDIEFAVEGAGESFTISTTRPELLAACVGVTAHPDDPRFKGMFGKHAVTPAFFARVPIFPSEHADPEKGTGILMVCTFGDQTDVQWWRENSLQLRQIVGRNGRVLPRTFGEEGWESARPDQANANFAELVGKRLPSARAAVVEMLRDPANSATGNGAPLQAEPRTIEHPVRYYEKGESPLEYLTSRQWFVRLLDKKERLLEFGRRIQWRPDYMRKRYENWTENLNVDWAISRQRYFGVPFPVWYPLNQDGQPEYNKPILATPDQLPVDPMTQVAPGYQESQRNQPGGFTGEPDVFDTWFTSSLTPQIVARWGDPDDQMASLFPMDIRPQAHDIIRTWAFYTIAKAMLHQDDVPWRNVIVSGWILDPDRKKMSKSRGNVVVPTDILDQYGADPVRYWSASARLGVDTAHEEQLFKVGRRLVTKIYNAGKFVLSQTGPKGDITNELDRAFVAELRDVVERATSAMEQYEFAQALDLAETFFWSAFTDNYIELVKRRVRSEDDPAGRASAVAGLRLGLSVVLRLFAPVLPTITDEVWSWVFASETGHESIHTAPWPSAEELANVPAPEDAASFEAACDAIAAVRKAKSDLGISLGKPLATLTLKGDDQGQARLRRVLEDVAAAAGADVDTVTLTNGAATTDGAYGAEAVPVEG